MPRITIQQAAKMLAARGHTLRLLRSTPRETYYSVDGREVTAREVLAMVKAILKKSATSARASYVCAITEEAAYRALQSGIARWTKRVVGRGEMADTYHDFTVGGKPRGRVMYKQVPRAQGSGGGYDFVARVFDSKDREIGSTDTAEKGKEILMRHVARRMASSSEKKPLSASSLSDDARRRSAEVAAQRATQRRESLGLREGVLECAADGVKMNQTVLLKDAKGVRVCKVVAISGDSATLAPLNGAGFFDAKISTLEVTDKRFYADDQGYAVGRDKKRVTDISRAQTF